MNFGLALALACALATSVSFLLKHRGAVLAPPVRLRHPLRSAAQLFRSKWFAVGWLVAVGAWALHVGALAGGVRASAEPILRLTRYYDYRDAVTWRAEREWPA